VLLLAAMRVWQEQMLKSRQLVLAQQAKSAVQQANKAQREVRSKSITSTALSTPQLVAPTQHACFLTAMLPEFSARNATDL
jgi:type II secretory pathway pseudopilin PulG